MSGRRSMTSLSEEVAGSNGRSVRARNGGGASGASTQQDMRRRWLLGAVVVAALLTLVLSIRPAAAVLVLTPPPEASDPQHKAFYANLAEAIQAVAKHDDPILRKLHAEAVAAPATIVFRPITDDRTTWASDGDRERGHTERADRRKKRQGASHPVGATIYLPPWAVEKSNRRFGSGTLVHEMTHALDLAAGRYSPVAALRERRAVFIANIWREHAGYRLRGSYHGQFPTPDYQAAKQAGRIADYAAYVFTRADFPDIPAR